MKEPFMDGIFNFFKNLIESYGALWLIGQGFGIIAIVLGFLSYQVKTKSKLLFLQGAVAFAFIIHYLLIGAYTGMAMNALNILRNFLYDRRTKKGSTGKALPIIFVIVQAVMCLFTWDGWYSIFILAGICINTYCMSLSDPRRCERASSSPPLWCLFTIFLPAPSAVPSMNRWLFARRSSAFCG